jgi:Domain of unknown function (DUF5615)
LLHYWRGADTLRNAGHDVRAVADQALLSAPDDEMLGYCRLEDRALISLDRGLADPLAHNPSEYAGIIILRLPRNPRRVHLNRALRVLIAGLEKHRPAGSLWLVRAGRIRIFKQGRPWLNSHGRRGIRLSQSSRTSSPELSACPGATAETRVQKRQRHQAEL